MKVQAFFDQSTFVRTTYHGLKKEIVQALALIAIVILLFLQSFRGTMIVSVAIPLSFAITLIVLYALRPGTERLHPRRPHAGDGPARG